MQDALGVLEAKANSIRLNARFYSRRTLRDGIYIDLCNEKWEAVEITSEGWRIVQNPPVRFRRSRGMQPLPIPREAVPSRSCGA